MLNDVLDYHLSDPVFVCVYVWTCLPICLPPLCGKGDVIIHREATMLFVEALSVTGSGMVMKSKDLHISRTEDQCSRDYANDLRFIKHMELIDVCLMGS